ncbi:MAG: RNA pyrophosphohydrolase [Myxococcales bacterium]|nr:RNA pyrophosphohydrolase [Myxococcales bacterium]
MDVRKLSQYRPNVGIALFNSDGLVFVAKRISDRPEAPWQMPQGGMHPGEIPKEAALRELGEETGVSRDLVSLLGNIDRWLTYDFPPEVRSNKQGHWLGQKQRWFAFRFHGRDEDVNLSADNRPEFSDWRWEHLSVIPSLIIPWKRSVYTEVAKAFSVHTKQPNTP